jgi:hypothetical protein
VARRELCGDAAELRLVGSLEDLGVLVRSHPWSFSQQHRSPLTASPGV